MVGWSETLVALKGIFSFKSARTDDFPQPYTMDSTTLTGQGALWGPVVVVVVVVVPQDPDTRSGRKTNFNPRAPVDS